jgi:hypothetical protein
MRIDHKAAGAGSVAGAHGRTMATGKGQPGCDGDGRWGETHHLPRSSRMAQTPDVVASFVLPSLSFWKQFTENLPPRLLHVICNP